MLSFATWPYMIGPILFALLGAAGLVCGFIAPKGRRALTGIGSGLILFASVLNVALVALFPRLDTMLSASFGGRTAVMVIDGLNYAAYPVFATGLLLLVFGATRRPPRTRRPAHAAAGPYPPGPSAPRPHGPVQR